MFFILFWAVSSHLFCSKWNCKPSPQPIKNKKKNRKTEKKAWWQGKQEDSMFHFSKLLPCSNEDKYSSCSMANMHLWESKIAKGKGLNLHLLFVITCSTSAKAMIPFSPKTLPSSLRKKWWEEQACKQIGNSICHLCGKVSILRQKNRWFGKIPSLIHYP